MAIFSNVTSLPSTLLAKTRAPSTAPGTAANTAPPPASSTPPAPDRKRMHNPSTLSKLTRMGIKAITATGISIEGLGHVIPKIVTPDFLKNLNNQCIAPVGMGKFVTGIPGTKPDADVRSTTLLDLKTGKCVTNGTHDENGKLIKYSQQSMSKPVAEALAIKLIGLKSFKEKVGFDASGRPYNDKVTYPDRPGVPYNGNVNIGALKVWDILVTEARKQGVEPIDMYLGFEKKLANNDKLEFNEEMAHGEFTHVPPEGGLSNNMKLLGELKDLGNLENDPEEVYEAYCKACATMIDTEDSARIMSKFYNGKDLATGEEFMPKDVAEHTTRSMTISGMYDEAGAMYADFGAAIKSGVDGGLMGMLPSKIPGDPPIIFATHHAELNPRGNSHEGIRRLKALNEEVLIFPDDEKLTKPATLAKGALKKAKKSVKSTFSSGSAAAPAVASAPGRKDINKRETDQKLSSEMLPGSRERLESGIQAKLEAKKMALAAKLDNKLQETLRNTPEEKKVHVIKAAEDEKETALKQLDYKGGLYLKYPKNHLSFNGGTLLFREADKNGKMKSYYHVPDRHHLEKVVVSEGDVKAGDTARE